MKPIEGLTPEQQKQHEALIASQQEDSKHGAGFYLCQKAEDIGEDTFDPEEGYAISHWSRIKSFSYTGAARRYAETDLELDEDDDEADILVAFETDEIKATGLVTNAKRVTVVASISIEYDHRWKPFGPEWNHPEAPPSESPIV